MSASTHPDQPESIYTFRHGYMHFVFMTGGRAVLFNTNISHDHPNYKYHFIYKWIADEGKLKIVSAGDPYWLTPDIERRIQEQYQSYLAKMSVGVEPGETT